MKHIQRLIFITCLLISSYAPAAELYWDPGMTLSTSSGGNGNWDTNSADLNTAVWFNGSADVVWTNSYTNDAYFTGTAGTVTIVDGEQIYADDVYFTNVTGNYVITNATGAEVLNVASNIDTGGSEDIIGVQIGNSTTLNKNGNGRLHLPVDSSATLTGNVMVNAGEVSVENNNSLGNNTTVTVTNGAALELNSTTNANLSSVNCNVILSGSGITNSGALRNTSGYTEFNGNVTIAGNVTLDSDVSQLNLNGYQGAAITTSGAGNYNVTSTGAGAILIDSGGFNIGTGSIIVEGPSTFYLYVPSADASDNSFASVYVGNGATYEVENDGDFGTVPATLMTTNVILDGGTLANAAGYTMSSTRGIMVTTNGGTLSNIGGAWTTCNIYSSNTAVTFTGTGNFRPAGSGGSSGNIFNLGTGAVIKDGSDDFNTTYPSSLTFSNMVLNGGSLTFNYDMSSGEPSTLGSIPSSYCPSNIWLNGGALHAGHSTTIYAVRGIYVAAVGGTIADTVSSGGTLTVDSIISGPGSMNFPNGVASHITTVVLAANNTYAGTTTIGLSNTVTLSGASGTLGTGDTIANGQLNFDRSGSYTYNGNISGGSNILISGTGVITLTGACTYSGAATVSAGTLLMDNTNASPITVNSGGTLGGTGVFGGAVTVNSGGTLALGAGTFSVSNNLSIAGNVSVTVNSSASPSSGMAIVTGTLGNTGTGTVSVSNLGPALAPGNSFQLFSQPVSGAGTMTISGGGVTWVNNLASSGSISVLSALSSPGISNDFLSGTNFVFSGTNSADAGAQFYVLASTNLLTPLANWTPISTNSFGSNGAFSVTNPIVPGSPQLFYILKLQ